MITDRWVFLSNPLHGAVKFTDAPTRTSWGWLHVADVTLFKAKIHKRTDALFERCVPQLFAIEGGFLYGLLTQEISHDLRRQGCCHGLKQT